MVRKTAGKSFFWSALNIFCIHKYIIINLGPGPAKYLLPSTVGYEHHAVNKYRNPQYTMRARYGFNPKVFGPGAKYNVENMTRYGKASPPAYSIYSRTMPPASKYLHFQIQSQIIF